MQKITLNFAPKKKGNKMTEENKETKKLHTVQINEEFIADIVKPVMVFIFEHMESKKEYINKVVSSSIETDNVDFVTMIGKIFCLDVLGQGVMSSSEEIKKSIGMATMITKDDLSKKKEEAEAVH